MQSDLWVGVRGDAGTVWVFDKSMPHFDETMAYVFSVSTGTVTAYPRATLRTMLVPQDPSKWQVAVDAYLKWREGSQQQFLETEKNDAPDRIAWLAGADERSHEARENQRLKDKTRLKEVEAKHCAYLDRYSKPNLGVKEFESIDGRSSVCHRCKSPVQAQGSLQCNACGWIICSCGACGCGYTS